MAKASKKAAAKSAAGKANKLSIDLGSHTLDDKERLKLLAALHKTVSATVKTNPPQKQKGAGVKTAALKAGAGVAAGATITATFRDTEPGFSKLVATHKGLSKTITQSDTVPFENVKAGDIIRIEVMTLGKSEISIDRTAKPQEKKTSDSSFRFLFEIVE